MTLNVEAHAGEWTITPNITLEQAFSDNVKGVEDNEDADFFTTVGAGVVVTGTGARVTLDLDYQLTYQEFWEANELDGFSQDLITVGEAELYEDLFFINARAAVSEESVDRNGRSAGDGNRNLDDNQVLVVNYSVSPFLRTRFGGWVEAEARYEYRGVQLFNTDTSDVDDDDQASGSVSQLVSATLDSGEQFNRFTWSLEGLLEREDRGGGGNFDRDLVEARSEYAINRFIALIGTIGYEQISDDTDQDDDFDGPFWLAGFSLTPGPRTELRIQYGRRFGNNQTFDGDFTYRFSSRTRLLASYKETVTTQQGRLGDNLGGLVRDDQGNLVDPGTGLPPDPNDQVFDLNDETALERRFTLSLLGSRGRNTFSVLAYYFMRDLSNNGTDETTAGLQGEITRQLSSQLSAGLNAGFEDFNEDGAVGPDEDELVLRGRAFLDYQLSDTLVGSFNYTYFRRDQDNGGNITENLVSVRLSKEF